MVEYECPLCGEAYTMSATEWMWHRLVDCTGEESE